MAFWVFLIYSFLGYGLEKAFAALTHAPNQVRKGLLLLPLCPVYGLGMLVALAGNARGAAAAVWGGAAATAVEYGFHWGCERFLGVRFWDYSGVRGNLHGRVCLPFSVLWGVLTAGAARWVQPWVVLAAERIPPEVTYLFLLVFTADAVCTVFFLRATHDVEGLAWRAQTTWKR